MVERSVVVRLPLGLHARPAAELAVLAARFTAAVWLVRDGIAANAKSVLELMSLAVEHGTTVVVQAEGEDADEAVLRVADFLQRAEEG
ncbi:MAG: HPr family phosphocarrier protein [Candidatus Kapabacteria bacterium]|nr:HPr family phosphocarrier protein [Candidatus Kapabacteria bacterium]MDW8012051.1 HPr family phosphocarrier protein [Bacteroidota bacterium]